MNFSFPIEVEAIKFIAVVCRLGAFFFAFPVFNAEQVPARYKMLALLAFSIAMYPYFTQGWQHIDFAGVTLLKLLGIILSEILLGVAIGLFVTAAVDVFTYAGAIMDLDFGFNATSEFDPSIGQRTVISGLLYKLFLVFFLILDGHLELVKIAASSFDVLGPGAFFYTEDLLELVLRATNTIFVVGTQLALPAIVIIFMINLGMGILARIGEDFPVMVLSFALHLGIGLIILGVMIPTLLELCRRGGNEMLGFILEALSTV